MNKYERRSSNASRSSLFLVGRDSHGDWVVKDQSGRRGGLFIDRAEALKYAMFENGHSPQAVIMVSGVLELDIGAQSHAGQRPITNAQEPLQRVA